MATYTVARGYRASVSALGPPSIRGYLEFSGVTGDDLGSALYRPLAVPDRQDGC